MHATTVRGLEREIVRELDDLDLWGVGGDAKAGRVDVAV